MAMDLFETHKKMLCEESGIAPEVIAARGYRTVEKKAELKRLGFSDAQCNVPGLLIPIWGPNGEKVLYQFRPDEPRIKEGKHIKYETPSGAGMKLDVHPFAREKLADPSVPLLITEGVKKADAIVSHGYCCIALLGVWNWKGRNEYGGKVVLPEWDYVALNSSRQIHIIFDSDIVLKPEVYKAMLRLKAFLEGRSHG